MNTNAEQLPQLRDPFPLTQGQCEQYGRDGHIVLRGLASPAEVNAYRPVIAAAMQKHNPTTQPLAERDTYHQAFLQTANLWEVDDRVRCFTMARRFARVAAELMGVPAVRLWHDQALFKEPGGGPTPWHQDQYYWPLDTPHCITMWMPLVDVSATMGALQFATGSHHDGTLASLAISEESERLFRAMIAERDFPVVEYELTAGDATFHSGWALHAAGGNATDRMREVMTVIYYEAGAKAHEPTNPHQPADLARWLPGVNPGEEAASKLNPVLYEAGSD